ncbi:hypothetical protein ACS0TY_017939 [Phlomoides rotata]
MATTIPLDVNEDSTCQIKPGTELAELIAKTNLIIWDEAPMTKRFCFEALDKSLKDIIRDSSNSCKVLRLAKYMRLKTSESSSDETNQPLREFSNWILKVGDGDVGEYNDGYSEIEIPEQNLIIDAHEPIEEIVNALYPSIANDYCDPWYFEDRAILAPTHKVVN